MIKKMVMASMLAVVGLLGVAAPAMAAEHCDAQQVRYDGYHQNGYRGNFREARRDGEWNRRDGEWNRRDRFERMRWHQRTERERGRYDRF